MHVAHLLHVLAFAEDIEIIVPLLSETAGCFGIPECDLTGRSAFPAASPRNPLLQHLHYGRYGFSAGFADQQMKVFRHHYITPNDKIKLLPHFFQYFDKQIAATCRAKELLAAVTTAAFGSYGREPGVKCR
jgi:hypothetical protein